jgi:hypothetical protein
MAYCVEACNAGDLDEPRESNRLAVPRPPASLVEKGTMDDALYGQRDKRGNWKPFKRVKYPAVFVWPVQPIGILRWLFSYPSWILPWNLLYSAIAVAVWPDCDTNQISS